MMVASVRTLNSSHNLVISGAMSPVHPSARVTATTPLARSKPHHNSMRSSRLIGAGRMAGCGIQLEPPAKDQGRSTSRSRVRPRRRAVGTRSDLARIEVTHPDGTPNRVDTVQA